MTRNYPNKWCMSLIHKPLTNSDHTYSVKTYDLFGDPLIAKTIVKVKARLRIFQNFWHLYCQEFPFPTFKMQTRHNIQIYCLLFIAVLSLMVMIVPEVSSKPNMDEVANMAEAIRYLEKLDKYYSQVARPRYDTTSGTPVRHCLLTISHYYYLTELVVTKISSRYLPRPPVTKGNHTFLPPGKILIPYPCYKIFERTLSIQYSNLL